MFLIFKQFLSFIAINVILLFDIYLKIYADDNIESLYIFFSHFFIIIFIQFIIIYTVSKNILRQKEISKILLALFITLNIFVFKLANYQDINFLLESQLAQISIFFGLFITIFILYKFFHEKIIVIALIIFTPSALIQYSQSPILNKQANNENLIINSTEYPEFIQKPNVYLIGIDALAPFDVMNKSLS